MPFWFTLLWEMRKGLFGTVLDSDFSNHHKLHPLLTSTHHTQPSCYRRCAISTPPMWPHLSSRTLGVMCLFTYHSRIFDQVPSSKHDIHIY